MKVESIHAEVNGVNLTLKTAPGLFSPRKPDAGTMAMLSTVELSAGDRLLDLGCGYGLVGIYAAHVIGPDNVCLLDVDPTAVEMARENARSNGLPDLAITQSDGFRDFRESEFTKILSNPPYHADFAVAKHFILKGFNRLVIGGEMWFVTKREKWYRNKLKAVFGGVDVQHVDGYCVCRAEKRRASYARRR